MKCSNCSHEAVEGTDYCELCWTIVAARRGFRTVAEAQKGLVQDKQPNIGNRYVGIRSECEPIRMKLSCDAVAQHYSYHGDNYHE